MIFVSNNGYRMDKQELINLFKEADYACYVILEKLARARSFNWEEAREVHKELFKDYCNEMIENLIENEFFKEE